MIRRLLTVVSGLSLVVCVATVVLWVRSHRVGDYLSARHREGGMTGWCSLRAGAEGLM